MFLTINIFYLTSKGFSMKNVLFAAMILSFVVSSFATPTLQQIVDLEKSTDSISMAFVAKVKVALRSVGQDCITNDIKTSDSTFMNRPLQVNQAQLVEWGNRACLGSMYQYMSVCIYLSTKLNTNWLISTDNQIRAAVKDNIWAWASRIGSGSL